MVSLEDGERWPFGEGNGNPLQCSCLENPKDRVAWWAAVYGVTQSRTRLKRLSSSSRPFVLSYKLKISFVVSTPRKVARITHLGSFGCTGTSLPHAGLLWLWRSGLLSSLLTVASLTGDRGLSCPSACGIFPGQGLNLCSLHWQADS